MSALKTKYKKVPTPPEGLNTAPFTELIEAFVPFTQTRENVDIVTACSKMTFNGARAVLSCVSLAATLFGIGWDRVVR
jgi:hypothetical protein